MEDHFSNDLWTAQRMAYDAGPEKLKPPPDVKARLEAARARNAKKDRELLDELKEARLYDAISPSGFPLPQMQALAREIDRLREQLGGER